MCVFKKNYIKVRESKRHSCITKLCIVNILMILNVVLNLLCFCFDVFETKTDVFLSRHRYLCTLHTLYSALYACYVPYPEQQRGLHNVKKEMFMKPFKQLTFY